MAANQPLAAQQTGAPISRSKGSDPIESALATSAHLQVAVRGLRCAACVTRLQDTLRADPNVMDAQVNLATERASIHYASDQPQTPARLGAAASASGFDLLPLRNGADDDSGALDEAALAEQDHAQARRDTKLLVLAVLCSLPLALQMVGMGLGQPWHLPYWLELALATPVQFVVGATFYLGAWRALSARSTNMDVLVALGSSAAYGYSVWLVVTEGSMATGQLYFEASALILTLIYAGKLLERHARQRTSAALKALQALAPETANLVLADGTAEHTVTKVLVANLQLGQLLVVHPGERIPADGVIESGASDVDESMLTGESVAVARNPGDMVVGGSLNGAGNLQVRVAALGPDATLGRIAAMVEAAAAGTAPVQQLVDKVSAWFVPAVLVIAAATAAGWWLAGADFGSGLIAAVAVLVIACPCALGLATPTAIVAGTGAAARAGILVKNVAAMERANAVQFVYFDKTGTLTHGRPRITAEHCVSGQTPDNCLLLAASVEAASEHPLRHAFAEAAAKRGLAMHSALEFRALAGRGIKARCNGQDIVVGNSRLMRETGIQLETADEFAPLAPGSSRVFIGCDAMLIGAFDVADELRPDAANTLQRLGAQGIEVGILSGDASLVVNATAAELGPNIDAHAEMLPADKAEYLAELRHGGRIVAFVGDGVNDAPALASADIGIAIGGATDVAIETADITLLRPEPTLVLAALEISRRTVAKIAQNLFWACGYNVVCIPLAAFGFLSPALAGAAMAASSISVVVNSLALARWRPV